MSEVADDHIMHSMSDRVIIKKALDEWLDEVDYADLNDGSYVPSQFSLIFMNFIKLVNGEEGESHKTPPVHLKMLDKLTSPASQIVNLCFRGAAKTTLFFEYLILFLAFYGYLPGFGKIEAMIYVSDSMENGVKAARKNVEFRYHNSAFLQEWIPQAHFTDNYIEFTNRDGHRLGCKMFGAKTGLRGTKIFGKRPPLAVLDDLVSDDDAKSRASMEAIKDTVYKGVNYALDPTRRKIIFNGTPFNKDDIMIEAVESGAWDVNVWPVCERFPCSKEEFHRRLGGPLRLRLHRRAIPECRSDREGRGLHAGADVAHLLRRGASRSGCRDPGIFPRPAAQPAQPVQLLHHHRLRHLRQADGGFLGDLGLGLQFSGRLVLGRW